MSVSGPKMIANPFISLFAFVAAQRGASNEQIGEVIGHAPRAIFHSNREIQSVLAFPLSGPKAGPLEGVTLDDVKAWFANWQVAQAELLTAQVATLQVARLVIDPWLKHDHGRWVK